MSFCKCKCRYLLSVDPGLMTGVCLIDLSDPEDPVQVWSAEITIPEFYDKIEAWVADENTHTVIEGFRITDGTPDSPWSLNLIGIVEYLCYHNKKELDMQWPYQKDFADNDKLRKVNFWHVGEAGHANDAFRHAMVWIVDRNRKWTRKLLV